MLSLKSGEKKGGRLCGSAHSLVHIHSLPRAVLFLYRPTICRPLPPPPNARCPCSQHLLPYPLFSLSFFFLPLPYSFLLPSSLCCTSNSALHPLLSLLLLPPDASLHRLVVLRLLLSSPFFFFFLLLLSNAIGCLPPMPLPRAHVVGCRRMPLFVASWSCVFFSPLPSSSSSSFFFYRTLLDASLRCLYQELMSLDTAGRH